METAFIVSCLTLTVAVIGWYILYIPKDYPVGPRKHWLVENLYDMPVRVDWDKLRAWQHEFGTCQLCTSPSFHSTVSGDMVYLTAFGKSVLILNTPTAIKDVLEKRAKNFSHRPQTVMVSELFGLGKVYRLLLYEVNGLIIP